MSQGHEIRTQHVRAGFAAGLEGLKAMEIRAKQYDKEGPFFGPQNVRKSRRAKMGLPSLSLISVDLSVAYWSVLHLILIQLESGTAYCLS